MRTFIQYINFFFYHAINWNPLLAAFLLYHTIRGEKKYRINTFHDSDLDRYTIDRGDKSKSSRYEAVNYFILENLLENFRKLYPNEKTLLDVGCGKGRVLAVAAWYGFTKITGIDFAKELCAEAEKNTENINKKFPAVHIRIVCDDVLNCKIGKDESVFFLFNPFNAEVMEKFAEKIEQSISQYHRSIYILYASPKHMDVLTAKNYTVIYRIKKMNWLEGVILKR